VKVKNDRVKKVNKNMMIKIVREKNVRKNENKNFESKKCESIKKCE